MTSQTDFKFQFQQAVQAVKQGDKLTAQAHLRQALALNPDSQAAWLYLAGISSDAVEARTAIERAQALDPNHPHLVKAKAWVEKRWPPQKTDLPSPPHAVRVPKPVIKSRPAPTNTQAPSRPTLPLFKLSLGLFTVGILVIVLFTVAALSFPSPATANLVSDIQATPTRTVAQHIAVLEAQLDDAHAVDDETARLEILQQIRLLNPTDPSVSRQLADIYLAQGLELKAQGDLPAANRAFGQAVAARPDLEQARQELNLASLYLDGIQHYKDADWPAAIETFELVFGQDANYPNIREQLYSSYINQGLVLTQRDLLTDALVTYQTAAAYLPQEDLANNKVAEITMVLSGTTTSDVPAPTGDKRVVVDISAQRAYTYQGDEQVHEFVVSTGEPGRNTAVGSFSILNKIPMAYASTWNLDMPNWLGIYWSGSLQNGFHAVPTVRHTGQTMWEGYLGTPVSYGCVILSIDDSQTLFDWVDIGTPVQIQY